MSQCMITTIDNPFNPFTHFDDWFAFDTSIGYNTCSYLARIAKTSTSLSDADYEMEVEDAIDWICENDPFKIYKKVYEKQEVEGKPLVTKTIDTGEGGP